MPMSNRKRAIDYYELVRDKLKEQVKAGKGAAPEEKYRLQSLFMVPNHAWKILDWMEREHGACIAIDYLSRPWGDIEWDEGRPFLTLVRRAYAEPICCMFVPVEKYTETVVRDALDYKAAGTIYRAYAGCHHTCAAIKQVRDAPQERAEVPRSSSRSTPMTLRM